MMPELPRPLRETVLREGWRGEPVVCLIKCWIAPLGTPLGNPSDPNPTGWIEVDLNE